MSCCEPRFVNGCEWGALCGQPRITHGTYTAPPLSPGPLLLAERQTCEKGTGKGLRVEVSSKEEAEEWIPLAVCWCTLHPSEYWGTVPMAGRISRYRHVCWLRFGMKSSVSGACRRQLRVVMPSCLN